jgi:hypothetical protein
MDLSLNTSHGGSNICAALNLLRQSFTYLSMCNAGLVVWLVLAVVFGELIQLTSAL